MSISGHGIIIVYTSDSIRPIQHSSGRTIQTMEEEIRQLKEEKDKLLDEVDIHKLMVYSSVSVCDHTGATLA